jgi:mannosyl-oligosaccharide alpha-1,2-mannosidase
MICYRPEAIESVFIMYRITGDESWRDKGWRMFQAIESHTKARYGYSSISDVTSKVVTHTDGMESFWLSETLKYFYLLFSSPDTISLDDYVLYVSALSQSLPPQSSGSPSSNPVLQKYRSSPIPAPELRVAAVIFSVI